MIRIRRVHMAPALLLLVAGGVAGAAFAASSSDGGDPVTAEDYYTSGMTLEEIGKASVGEPGKPAPPCPDADTVTKLKEAKITVGPCDPLPEAGQVQIVPDPKLEAPEPSGGRVCAVTNVHAGAGITGTVCGANPRILDADGVQQDGKWCLKATYVLGPDSEAVTDVVCEGDQPKADGLRVAFTNGK